MNKFFELMKSLFGLSDEQVKQGLQTLKEEKIEGEGESEKGEKESESKDTTKLGDETGKPSSDSVLNNPDKKGEEGANVMTAEEVKALKDELASVKAMLEQTKAEKVAEQRETRIKSYADCVDYDVLKSLLEGVDDKDMDEKVKAIKGEKPYLFKAKDTKGFNPASPDTTLTGVEAAFYDLNPDLK